MELAETKPNDCRVDAYADYLVEMYVDEEAEFPPHIWASLSADSNRTTNGCESFHSHFNQKFYHSHPQLYVFLDALQSIQIETYIKIQSSEKPKKSRSEKQSQLRQRTIDMYRRHDISRLQYVKIMSKWYSA